MALLWHLGSEGSVPEVFNYLKWALLAVVLAATSRRYADPLLAVLAALFLVVLLDDSLQLHERAGGMIAGFFGTDDNLAQVTGEVAYWLATAAVFVVLIFFGWRASSPDIRRAVLPLAVLFGGVAMCGAGFDVLQALSRSGSLFSAALGILEDGGEMAFASAQLGYAVGAFLVPNTVVGLDPNDRRI